MGPRLLQDGVYCLDSGQQELRVLAGMANVPGEIHSFRQTALIATLRKSRMFAELSPAEIDAVADGCSLRTLQKGEMLFREGGIPLQQWERLMKEGGEPADLEQFISRMKAMNLPNSVFIDNSASADVVNHYASLFAASISVVTYLVNGYSQQV